jgi:Fe-S cluster assembly ATP-binding protein
MSMLDIQHISISAENTPIISNVSLSIPQGQVHAIMGPNGAGKSTLANAIAGHPSYAITHGDVCIDDQSLLRLSPDGRAHKGLFLSMQHPPNVHGVSIANFLRLCYNTLHNKQVNPLAFRETLVQKLHTLRLSEEILSRSLGVGFSGGEKKQLEILQLLVLEPVYAILDETDSGLDVDALKIVSDGINQFRSQATAVLVITHYDRLLSLVEPDVVHVMVDGSIVKTGDKALVHEIQEKGFEPFMNSSQ